MENIDNFIDLSIRNRQRNQRMKGPVSAAYYLESIKDIKLRLFQQHHPPRLDGLPRPQPIEIDAAGEV